MRVFRSFWCSLRIMAGIHWVIDSFDTAVSVWVAGTLSEFAEGDREWCTELGPVIGRKEDYTVPQKNDVIR